MIDADSHPVFVSVRPRHTRVPLQGWKLHVSATAKSASSSLAKVLPVLISSRCHFKVAKSVTALQRLAETVVQSGKFITVYPQDDADAVRLAQLLHKVTKGMRGPCLRTDRPLGRSSIVHYRYGGFKSRYLQNAQGREILAIETPDGELVPDRRLGCYSPPSWANDPFVSAGLIEGWEDKPIFASRFLLVSLLQQGFQSDVLMGIDLEKDSLCLIKRSRDDGLTQSPGGQSSLRLAHEASLLRKLAHLTGIPRLLECFKFGDDTILVVEWIESVSMNALVREYLAEVNPVPLTNIIHYSSELAATLAGLHTAGVIHGDIKPANILVTDSERIYLIDFDHAAEISSQLFSVSRGTPGWESPERSVGSPAAVTDDIFGFGATLFFICTGIAAHEHPTLLLDPAQAALTFRQIRPDLPEKLLAVILRCVAKDPTCRFQCAPDLQAAISTLSTTSVSLQENVVPQDSAMRSETICKNMYRKLEQEVAPVASGGREFGLAGDDRSSRISLDLASGLSGMLMVLAIAANEMATTTHSIRHAAKLLLDQQKQRPEFSQPGLFTGKAGCALAIAYAGSVLHDEILFAQADELINQVTSAPPASVDVYSGLAGLILLYLSLFELTRAPKYLALAERCGTEIINNAEPGSPGLCWRNENWNPQSRNNRYFNYLHGTAGVADALLSLGQASGTETFRSAAAEAGIWLAANTFPVQDESVVVWSSAQGEKAAGVSQAHGSGGIGRFLLHAWQQDLFPQARELTLRAARAAAAARWLSPNLGHGLSGSIDFLLDVYEYLPETWLLDGARSLHESMLRSGDHLFSDFGGLQIEPEIGVPAYLTGYAGILPVLLRLQDRSRRSVFPVPGLTEMRRVTSRALGS